MEGTVATAGDAGLSSWVGLRVRNPDTGDEGTVSHVSAGDASPTLHVLLDSGATEDVTLGAPAPAWEWFDESTAGEERWLGFDTLAAPAGGDPLEALTLPRLLASRGEG